MHPPADSPAPRDPVVQAAVDAEHLKVLEIVFYVAGGMTVLVSCIFIFHFTIFLVFGLNPEMFDRGHNHPPPPGLFLGLVALFGSFIVLGWIFGALQIYAGRCLRRRRHRVFVMVVARSSACSFPGARWSAYSP